MEEYSRNRTAGTPLADAVCLAHAGVPPEVPVLSSTEDMPDPHPRPLFLSTAEVEVMLCFALSSPLHYGHVEEDLCAKLRQHLRGLYVWRAVEACR